MKDIENEVFDACAEALEAVEPGCFTTSVRTLVPADFPAASVMEISNVTDTSRNTSAAGEQASIVTYRVDVFSNLRQGARTQAKRMAEAVDGVLTNLNFTRVYSSTTYDPSRSSVYQMTFRYTAGVSSEGKIYRR